MTKQQLNDSVVRRQMTAWQVRHHIAMAAIERQLEPVEVQSLSRPGTTFQSIKLYQSRG